MAALWRTGGDDASSPAELAISEAAIDRGAPIFIGKPFGEDRIGYVPGAEHAVEAARGAKIDRSLSLAERARPPRDDVLPIHGSGDRDIRRGIQGGAAGEVIPVAAKRRAASAQIPALGESGDVVHQIPFHEHAAIGDMAEMADGLVV